MANKNGLSFQGPVNNLNLQGSFVGPGPVTTLMDDQTSVNLGKSARPTLKDLLADKQLKTNLICSCMVWLHGSFNFYLITFYLKSFPGNIFVNSMCFATADLLAYLSTGIVLKYLMIRQGLAFSYSLSLLSGTIYLLNRNTTISWLIPAMIAFSRVGASMSYNIGYVSVSRLFPTQFITTAFGYINLVSHLVTTGAPMVAELKEPVPMIVYCCNAASAIFFAWQLLEADIAEKMKKEKEKTERDYKLKNFISDQD
jgi:hypothetical protein